MDTVSEPTALSILDFRSCCVPNTGSLWWMEIMHVLCWVFYCLLYPQRADPRHELHSGPRRLHHYEESHLCHSGTGAFLWFFCVNNYWHHFELFDVFFNNMTKHKWTRQNTAEWVIRHNCHNRTYKQGLQRTTLDLQYVLYRLRLGWQKMACKGGQTILYGYKCVLSVSVHVYVETVDCQ